MDAKARPERSKVLKILGIATLLLVAGASWLAISTARYMKGILRDQFNEQQLVLARHAAQRVEAQINDAIDELLLLNSLPAIQYCDPDSYEALLLSTLPVFNGSSIIAIRRIDRDGNPIFAANEQGIIMRNMGPGAAGARGVSVLGLRSGKQGQDNGYGPISQGRGKRQRRPRVRLDYANLRRRPQRRSPFPLESLCRVHQTNSGRHSSDAAR